MPKVSQQYREARRAEILEAARRCFLRNGFHETSMQDVFVESGLSAGAVYRYFAGKQDMIVALAEDNVREVVAMLHGLAAGRPQLSIGTALAEVLEAVRVKQQEQDLGAMALLVWSEALRSPAIADRFEEALVPLRADLAEVVAQRQNAGALPGGVSPAAFAALLMSVIPGFILQLALFGPASVDQVPAAVRALFPD